MDSKELVDTIISICEDEKAVDLVVFNMNSKSILADYYLFCSCSSEVHIRGLVGTIEKELKDRFEMLPKSVEGKSGSRWILVDYLDVLLHIFHPEKWNLRPTKQKVTMLFGMILGCKPQTDFQSYERAIVACFMNKFVFLDKKQCHENRSILPCWEKT